MFPYPKIIHFNRIFHFKHPFGGTPFMEPPIYMYTAYINTICPVTYIDLFCGCYLDGLIRKITVPRSRSTPTFVVFPCPRPAKKARVGSGGVPPMC